MPPENMVVAERRGRVLVLAMNRPRQRNALDAGLRAALRASFDSFDADPDLRCAVLTGNGPAFCAGADLKEMANSRMQLPPRDFFTLLGSDGPPSKPVIAAVNGAALGAGFYLAQECDLCIAADAASFAIPEVRHGRGSPWAVPLITLLPRRIMMEVLLTGEAMSAWRAYEVGLVNVVVPSTNLMPTALAMAALIAQSAPLSVRAAKQMVKLATEMGQTDAVRASHLLYEHVYLSEDAQEGPRAFVETRDPRWKGR